MPAFVYPFAKAMFIGARPDYQLNWVRDTFMIAVCRESFDPSPANKFLANIHPAENLVGTPVEMRGKAILPTAGATAATVTFRDIPAGTRMEYLLIYHDSGDPATSELVVLLGLNRGFPLLADGTPFVVRWNNGIITP